VKSEDRNTRAVIVLVGKIDNVSFEGVEHFIYLGTTLTNQILFRKKLRANRNQEMFAVVRCRIFCLQVCCPKILRLVSTEVEFCLLFCTGVKVGHSH
jgi:hypothetical protein